MLAIPSPNIACLVTSADIKSDRDARFLEYKAGIEAAVKFLPSLPIRILETRCFRNSNLELLGSTYYSKTHIPNIKNKGVLWALALRKYVKNLPKQGLRPTHLVILTGRYELKSSYFYEQMTTIGDFDFIGKRINSLNEVNTGLFCIKLDLLEQWLDNYSFIKSEIYSISVELHLMSFLDSASKLGKSIIFLEKLDLFMPVFGRGVRDFRLE
jgi:hypothetical protein